MKLPANFLLSTVFILPPALSRSVAIGGEHLSFIECRLVCLLSRVVVNFAKTGDIDNCERALVLFVCTFSAFSRASLDFTDSCRSFFIAFASMAKSLPSISPA